MRLVLFFVVFVVVVVGKPLVAGLEQLMNQEFTFFETWPMTFLTIYASWIGNLIPKDLLMTMRKDKLKLSPLINLCKMPQQPFNTSAFKYCTQLKSNKC